MTLQYLLIIDLPKFDPLTATDKGGFMRQPWAKMSTFIPLRLRLSGMEFG
jgi:hypothetical protein